MKRKLAVLLTAATVFSAILPTTCMAAEKRQTFRREQRFHSGTQWAVSTGKHWTIW